MSVQFDSSRSRWVVRWSDAGRQRTRRFAHEGAARGFDAERRQAKLAVREAHAAGLDVRTARKGVTGPELRMSTLTEFAGLGG